jgi:magnesium chelatase subunit D
MTQSSNPWTPLAERARNRAERVERVLACAAVTPGLRSPLVFDADSDTVFALAAVFQRLLGAATGADVEILSPGATHSEDRLWGEFTVQAPRGGPSFAWRPGLLSGSPDGSGPLKLIVLPDLTRVSLAVARACVMLLGADVVHLERHGRHEVWRPELCWLAGCPWRAVGQISPHLLDRFALRLRWAGAGSPEDDRADDLEEMAVARRWPRTWPFQPGDLRRALGASAAFTEEAGHSVLGYYPPGVEASVRREIGLARLAAACARLRANSKSPPRTSRRRPNSSA